MKILNFFLLLFNLTFSQEMVDGIIVVVGKHPILHSEILQQSQIIAINKELKWMDPSHRGFLTLECDKDKILAIFHFINEIKKIDATITSRATFNIQKDSLKINQLFA